MRVLILGEGPTDLGRSRPDGTLELESALPILIRKLLAEAAPGMPVEVHAQEISKKPRRFPESARRMGPSRYGYANRLRGLLGLREGREADAIITVVDRDGDRHKDRIVELSKGRELVRGANKACAVGVAIEMIEAWLLADEMALRVALGNTTIQRQPDPESMTSRDEQSDRNPKGRLIRLMECSLGQLSDSNVPDYYANIAMAADIKILEQRCSEGFAPFAEQVRELSKG